MENMGTESENNDHDDEIEDEIDDEDDDEEQDEDKPKSKIVKMTQDKLNQITTRQHKKGEREGRKSVLKELGFETMEDAKSAITKSKTEKEAQDDKSKQEAEQEKAEASKTKAEAQRERKVAQIERRLLRTDDFDPKNLDYAVRMLDVDELLEAEDDEIDEAIEKLQEDLPVLWKAEEGESGKPRKPPVRKSTPGSPPKKRQATTQDIVQSRLQKRHGVKLQK